MSKTPSVSVCLPNLNGLPFLREQMDCIGAQTLADWELVICDSRSSDGSWEFLQTFRGDSRVRLFQVPREGIYAGWNECLSRATGEYVYIATSDDTCRPSLLERLVGLLEAHLDVDVAICGHEDIDADGNVVGDAMFPEITALFGDWLDHPHRRDGRTELAVNLCVGCHWHTVTAMVFRRSLLEKTGLFRTDCGSFADIPWRIKVVLNSDLLYVPEKLATWRRHDLQATGNRPATWRYDYYRCVRDTLEECRELSPEAWMASTDGLDRLLRRFKQVFSLASYDLNRTAIRRVPGHFLLGVVRALVHDPGYLAQRLRSGFAWDADQWVDGQEHFLRLVDECGLKWPPEPIDAPAMEERPAERPPR